MCTTFLDGLLVNMTSEFTTTIHSCTYFVHNVSIFNYQTIKEWNDCLILCSVVDLQTVRFKNELERNITIKLGYANAKVSSGKTKIQCIIVSAIGFLQAFLAHGVLACYVLWSR